jgi:hypothetical protein
MLADETASNGPSTKFRLTSGGRRWDVRNWPEAAVRCVAIVRPRWGISGHRVDTVDRSKMTHTVGLLRDVGATQHGERAGTPTYKCSISYSITSSAMESTLGGTSMPSARAV